MLFTVGALITFTAAVTLYRVFAPVRPNPEGHGWMSQQWLVEHRASDRP
jgi:hypothetical protein